MFRISCNETVEAGTYCAFYHDGIFIIVVLDSNCILTVDAKGIYQLEKSI